MLVEQPIAEMCRRTTVRLEQNKNFPRVETVSFEPGAERSYALFVTDRLGRGRDVFLKRRCNGDIGAYVMGPVPKLAIRRNIPAGGVPVFGSGIVTFEFRGLDGAEDVACAGERF